jgi:hypothetical protein
MKLLVPLFASTEIPQTLERFEQQHETCPSRLSAGERGRKGALFWRWRIDLHQIACRDGGFQTGIGGLMDTRHGLSTPLRIGRCWQQGQNVFDTWGP